MEDTLGLAAIPAITVISYLIAAAIKTTTLNRKYLPVICGTIGGILGTVAMQIMPDYPANDVLTAAAIGIASGFAATGVHQIFKQIKKQINR